MRMLGIETSEYVSSIALMAGGEVVAEQTFPSRMELCETLTRRIHELLGVEQLCQAKLDALAVSIGPGSFTGLRVGVATAKALAHACRLPLVGVSTQEALAAGAQVAPGTRLCVVQKARREHLYAGTWEKTENGARASGELRVVPVEQLVEFVGPVPCTIAGPATDLAAQAFTELPGHLRLLNTMPTAQVIVRLAASRLGQADPRAAFNLQPTYALPSQAERMKRIDLSTGGAPAMQLVSTTTSASAAPRLVIRHGDLADLAEIVRIENASFSSPWPESSIRQELAGKEGTLYLVAEHEGRVGGYLGTWLFAGEAHICTLATAPELRRSGLAEILLLTLLQEAAHQACGYAVLEYRVSNRSAAQLYKKLGFEYVHTRKRYYADTDEDAIVAAVADLASEVRQKELQRLREEWLGKHHYDLHFEV